MKIPGLTKHETVRLAKLEVLELQGFATAEDMESLEWLRAKIDKKRVNHVEEEGTFWISRQGARMMGKTLSVLESSGTKFRYLEESDED
jgi:hypothetical protein